MDGPNGAVESLHSEVQGGKGHQVRKGLTQEQLDVGLVLDDKLKKLCPLFDCMHALFGLWPNAHSSADGEYGVVRIWRTTLLTLAQEQVPPSADEETHPPATPTFILDGRFVAPASGKLSICQICGNDLKVLVLWSIFLLNSKRNHSWPCRIARSRGR